MRNLQYTPREMEVLGYISEGLNNREIAARLGLHCHTISNYTGMLYAKTGALNREQLFKIAQWWVKHQKAV